MKIKHLLNGLLAFVACVSWAPEVSAQSPNAMAGSTPQHVQDGQAVLIAHADPAQMLRLAIGLEHPHLVEEKLFLEALHTEGSPDFQHFLTAKEWNSRFAPLLSDEQALVDWATAQGMTVSHRYPHRLIVDVEAPIAVVERALAVTINRYQLGTATVYSNDHDPTLPVQLKSIVHSIAGLNSIEVLHPSDSTRKEPAFGDYSPGPAISRGAASGAAAKAIRPTSRATAGPNLTNDYYDPTDLYSGQAYDFAPLNNLGHCCNPTNNLNVSPPSSSIAIATAGTQNVSDFAGFQTQYPYLAYHYQQFSINGTPACCDDEGTLDFEWATAMANSFGAEANTAMVYMYNGANASSGTFSDIYAHMLSDGYARIMSTSWGCAELNCYSSSTMDTIDGQFSAMVGQGWTLLADSDDNGATAGAVNSSGNPICYTQDGVEFPASDPNVVAVGGTTLYAAGSFSSETGWQGGTGTGSCAANNGGSGGGFSAHFAAPSYQSSYFGYAKRSVPDVALNASIGQNYYFNGGLHNVGGTSIATPEMAGFFAQTNAYLNYVATVNGGCYQGTTCAPIGNGNVYLYYFGEHSSYARHYPFYDITSGCNSNDITLAYGLGYYCAGVGFDQVTGWGSINALQLAWAVVTYRAGDFGPPTAAFVSNATPGIWYNSDVYVEWSLTDTSNGTGLKPVGVSGFTYTWDAYPSDSTSLNRPATSDGFFNGPAVLSTAGYEYVAAAGQGCHTAYVRGYDNSGSTQVQSYGPVCYDTVPPVTQATFAGTSQGGIYSSAVTVKLTATDANSGIRSTAYSIDGGGNTTYTAPFTVSTSGTHTIKYSSIDVAGNSETPNVATLKISITGVVPVSVDLSTEGDRTGIVQPGTAVTGGGIDGAGGAYAANLVGSSITWSGAVFNLRPAGASSVVSEKSIALPAGQYSKLSMLATGVDGNQLNQNFVVTYTDGTTTTFTQSLSNWSAAQNYAGESVALTTAYKITSTGATHAGTYNVYGYTFALNGAKTAKSFTLPNNSYVVALAIDVTPAASAAATPTLTPPPGTFSKAVTITMSDPTPGAVVYYTTNGSVPSSTSTRYTSAITVSASAQIKAIAIASGYSNSAVGGGTYTISTSTSTAVNVDLSTSEDLYGIGQVGTPVSDGGIDRSSSAYATNLLGTSITWAGNTFKFAIAGAASAVTKKVVPLPSGEFKTLALLATAVEANEPSQPFVVTYTDGTSTTFTQSLSNWNTPQNYTGETTVLTTAYKLTATGATHAGAYNVYGYSFSLNSAKTVASLTLPSNLNVVLLAADLIH